MASLFIVGLALRGFAATGVTYDVEHLQYWIRTLKSHSLESVRKSAAKMLGAMDDRRVLAGLMEGLKDASAGVRKETVLSLGNLVDERAIPALESVYDRDPDPEVRKQAQIAIQRIQKRQEYDKEKEKSRRSN